MKKKSIENLWKLESRGINPVETDEDVKYRQTYKYTSLRYEDMLPQRDPLLNSIKL